jgi:hypothetical protein
MSNTTLWIVVGVFILIALGAGAAQIISSLGDKKIADDVRSDESRLHTDPHDPHHDPHARG